jgi:hypothetical protein
MLTPFTVYVRRMIDPCTIRIVEKNAFVTKSNDLGIGGYSRTTPEEKRTQPALPVLSCRKGDGHAIKKGVTSVRNKESKILLHQISVTIHRYIS